jgi:SAM-dependent methyltransferase
VSSADYVAANREVWNAKAAEETALGERAWAATEVSWGIWGIPEASVGVLPDVSGLDCVELGCGTAYVSAWLARRGARRVVGLDNSPSQLAIASRLQGVHSLPFPLIHADAERVPLRDESFDFAVSEYGAAIWCDPCRWIPEAARLLRPGGRLVFLGNAALLMLCVDDLEGVPAHTELQRPQRGMHRFDWPDTPDVEFHVSHGDMIKLLRSSGFDVLDLVELYPPEGATTPYPFVTPDWAARWPTEEVWVAEKRPG